MTLGGFLFEWYGPCDTVRVHTSGSTGLPKEMLAEKSRMLASARTTCDFLGLTDADTALLCLPLDYIAGKMMVVRSIERGMTLIAVEPSGRPIASLLDLERRYGKNFDVGFAAMVPMQVYNTLESEEETRRLRSIRHLIIGGGPVDTALARRLEEFPNAVWSTYAMTETLSNIGMRRLNGPDRSEWYTLFDKVSARLDSDKCLVIDAPEVCPDTLVTNDIAEIRKSADGSSFQVRILGRKDNVICSGGIKIHIEEVEARLHERMSIPFIITKKKDRKFGEIVVLLYEAGDEEKIRQTCIASLPRYQVPKIFMKVKELPYTGNSKPDRRAAMMMAENC